MFGALLYVTQTWTLRKLERKYLESFEISCWRRIQKIKCSGKVTNEAGEKKMFLNNILRRKGNWIGHILEINCLLRDATEEQMAEVKGVRRAPW